MEVTVKEPVLSQRMLDVLISVLNQSPVVMAALSGLYEGYELEGEYQLKIVEARLVKKDGVS